MSSPALGYGECVSSLRTSLSFLESSVDILGAGVQDFPRLSSVLKTVRVSASRLSHTDQRSTKTKQNKKKSRARLTSFRSFLHPFRLLQHYELIPQTTLAAAEASLRDEIGPFIALLLDRAEKHLERQARRIETLKARAELNAGRLSRYPSSSSASAASAAARGGELEKGKGKKGMAKGKPLDGGAALRAKVVRQRKEALKYGVERLELEVLQKERELRMRLDQHE